jgi:hypothetical protein
MAAAKPVQFLQELSGRLTHTAGACQRMTEFYNRKLWHQLTVELETVVDAPEFQQVRFRLE